MKRFAAILTAVVMALALVAAAYAMVRHLGLVDGLDFGCGQYYYTDIPNWQDYFSGEAYRDRFPKALYFVLFFAWGYVTYRFWKWVDARSSDDE